MPAAERFIRAGDLRLRVSSVTGDERPLLLIGGIGANVEMWRPLRRALIGRPTIAFDAPGTGRSETPRWPLRMRALAELVAKLLDALGEEEVDVLGYSFGGALAQQLVHDRPRRVRFRTRTSWSTPRCCPAPQAPPSSFGTSSCRCGTSSSARNCASHASSAPTLHANAFASAMGSVSRTLPISGLVEHANRTRN